MRPTQNGAREVVAVATVALLFIGGVALIQSVSTSSGNSTDELGDHSLSTLQAASVPTSAIDLTPEVPSPTEISVTPAIRDAFSSPALAANNVTLIRSDTSPLISQEQAMQAIADIGMPWAHGGTWENMPVTIQAYYGLATFGGLGFNGVWEGERNIPLPSGEVLDHIEGRPMWIIDYGNTTFVAGGCPDCPEPPDYDHSVYAVDAATGEVWIVWGYVGE